MSEMPYYKKDYHEPNSDIPNPSFGAIMKDFFFKPFTWNARETRKEFWISYAVQFVLSNIVGGLMLACLGFFSGVNTNGTYWSPQVAHATIATIICEIILVILLLWLKLGLLASAVRRMHDTNHEGWWVLLICVPFGWIAVLYFLILPTLEEPVRWNTYLFLNKK